METILPILKLTATYYAMVKKRITRCIDEVTINGRHEKKVGGDIWCDSSNIFHISESKRGNFERVYWACVCARLCMRQTEREKKIRWSLNPTNKIFTNFHTLHLCLRLHLSFSHSHTVERVVGVCVKIPRKFTKNLQPQTPLTWVFSYHFIQYSSKAYKIKKNFCHLRK